MLRLYKNFQLKFISKILLPLLPQPQLLYTFCILCIQPFVLLPFLIKLSINPFLCGKVLCHVFEQTSIELD